MFLKYFKIFLIDIFYPILLSSRPIHEKFFSILFISIPLVVLTGHFLPDFFLSLIALYFLIISIIKKLWKYYNNFPAYLFFCFYSIILISGLTSENAFSSLIDFNGPIFYFRYFFFISGVIYLLDNSPKLLKSFTNFFLLILIFVIIDGFAMWSTGINILGFKQPSWRVTGVFYDKEILGQFLSYTTPLLFCLLINNFENSKRNYFIFLFILMISEILIFVTNDRAAFLRMTLFILVFIILNNHQKILSYISFLILIISIIIIFFISPSSNKRYINTFEDISNNFIPYMPWSTLHEKHFQVALDLFVQNPFFGNGPQSFRIFCVNNKFLDGCANHPHNFFIQSLSELGIIAFLLLFSIFLYFTGKLLAQFKKIYLSNKKVLKFKNQNLFNILGFIIFWPLATSQSFYDNWLNSYLFLCIALILFFKNKKDYQ